jgi:hypothetical protein
MAKKNEVVKIENEGLQTYMQTTEQMIDLAKINLTENTIGTIEQLNQKIESFSGIVLTGILDIQAYNTTKEAIKDFKKIKTEVEKFRKELTAPALAYQNALIAHSREIVEPIDPVLVHLENEVSRIDDLQKQEQKRILNERIQLLTDAGFALVGTMYVSGAITVDVDKIVSMDENGFQFFIHEGQKELERRIIEENRIKLMREELEKERTEMASERTKMAAERAEMAEMTTKTQKLMNELKMQKEALSIVDGSVENPPVVVIEPVEKISVAEKFSDKLDIVAAISEKLIPANIPTPVDDSAVDGKSMLIAYNEGWNDAIDKISETMLASKPMQRDQFIESFNLLKK